MNLRKTVKRVAALSTGATMLGATLLGAMATDLDQYPNPLFIKDGKFDGLIVIGADGSTQDMLGAMDVISSLQAATISGGTTTTTTTSLIGDVYKVEKGSNILNIGEDIEEIKSKISDNNLPVILKDGEVKTRGGKTYEYEQEISFENTNLELQHFSDKDYNDDEATIGIPIKRGDKILTYTLDFKKDLPVNKLEDRKIEILGVEYDIISATNTSLELMQGATSSVLDEGETQVYIIDNKEYEIEVLGIYDNKDEVKFQVNGEITDSMGVGDIYELNDGITIGVREVLPNEAGENTKDMVEFFLGAKKLTLENGEELEIDDEDVDRMDVEIDSGSSNTIDEIRIIWEADEELFITEDSVVIMPGLNSIKFFMDKYSDGESITSIVADGDDGVKIEAELHDYDIDLTILSGDNGVFTDLGEDDDRQLFTTTCSGAFVIDMDIHEFFIVSYEDGDDAESNVLELTRVDDDGVTVKDYDGNILAENEDAEFDVGDMTILVNSFIENDNLAEFEVRGDCDVGLYTEDGLKISLPTNTTVSTANYTFVVTEEDKDGDIGDGVSFNIKVSFDNPNDIYIDFESTKKLSGDFVDEGNENVGYINSSLATKIVEDEDNEYVDMIYSDEETSGSVYIGSDASKTTTTETGETVQFTKIEVGAAVLDNSITNLNQNLIVIGGPAINKVTAQLLGKPYPSFGTDSGIEQNTGMLKLVEQTDGSVAVIVAGWEADDTQRAARVLAESDNYDLSGNMIKITGTNMLDINVNVPGNSS